MKKKISAGHERKLALLKSLAVGDQLEVQLSDGAGVSGVVTGSGRVRPGKDRRGMTLALFHVDLADGRTKHALGFALDRVKGRDALNVWERI